MEKTRIKYNSFLVAIKVLVPREDKSNKQLISLTDAWIQYIFLCIVPHIVAPHITLHLCDDLETKRRQEPLGATQKTNAFFSSQSFKYYISLKPFFSSLIALLPNRLTLMNMIF